VRRFCVRIHLLQITRRRWPATTDFKGANAPALRIFVLHILLSQTSQSTISHDSSNEEVTSQNEEEEASAISHVSSNEEKAAKRQGIHPLIAGLVDNQAQNDDPSSENDDEDSEKNEYGPEEYEFDEPSYLHREVDAKRQLEESRKARLEADIMQQRYSNIVDEEDSDG